MYLGISHQVPRLEALGTSVQTVSLCLSRVGTCDITATITRIVGTKVEWALGASWVLRSLLLLSDNWLLSYPLFLFVFFGCYLNVSAPFPGGRNSGFVQQYRHLQLYCVDCCCFLVVPVCGVKLSLKSPQPRQKPVSLEFSNAGLPELFLSTFSEHLKDSRHTS